LSKTDLPTGTPVILRAQGLRKSFGSTEVLKGVDLAVRAREVVCVIGPSGSGKSTLLRCLNRLETPSAGTVELDGVAITDPHVNLNRVRKDIGMVFQQFNLYPHMSALGNVTLALRKALKLPRAEADRRGRAALAAVGLADKQASHPSQLSGGQQQRVGIARALALEPKVMLFDEPTSALDPELVGGVLEAIRRMRDLGMTMVVVTHEMGFAREAADRVIFMNDGEIVEQGPPDAVFGNPQQERTRQFLARVQTR